MQLRRLLLLFSCTALFSSTAAAAPLNVMSFNLRYDGASGLPSEQANAWISTSGKHRRDLALQVIKEFQPDILGVQEALENQMNDLRQNLPKHDSYGLGRDDGRKQGEYCGIFYRKQRFKSIDQGTFWLNSDADRPGTRFPKTCCARIASWVILQDRQTNDQEYFVMNTHWDHEIQPARLFSAQLIRQRLKTLADGRPIVVVGDLNATTDNPAFRQLVEPDQSEGLQLLDSFGELHPDEDETDGTLSGFRGIRDGRRIDFVLFSQQFRVQTAAIVRTHIDDRYPSDHYPVTAALVLVNQ